MTRARILADYVSSGDELALKAPIAGPTFTGTVAIPNVANLETAVVANTAKVTNYNQTLADINALDVTELGTVTSGNLSNTAIVYPAGHIIGSNRVRYQWAGDVTVDTTSTGKAFGPVVPLQLVKANAKIYATYNIDETYQNGTSILYLNVAYKSSSFTAGTGNNAHGGAYLHSTHSQYRDVNSISKQITIHTFNETGLSNSAGDTYYFSPVGYTNTGTPGVNYYGAASHITLNVFEVS